MLKERDIYFKYHPRNMFDQKTVGTRNKLRIISKETKLPF